ncbi:MAG: hypothetical protein OEZ06_27900 [Myxococcales bacterium]|nr:hypothetical protein [Myxococcales bacterium]
MAEEVPAEPLSPYLLRRVHGFVVYGQIVRGRLGRALRHPLEYPDPAAPFLGYERFGLLTQGGYEPGLRTLVNLVTAGTSVRLAKLAGIRVGTKKLSVELYLRHVDDRWAEFARGVYALCKQKLGYRLPAFGEHEVSKAVAELCRQTLDFENQTLLDVRELIPAFPLLEAPEIP